MTNEEREAEVRQALEGLNYGGIESIEFEAFPGDDDPTLQSVEVEVILPFGDVDDPNNTYLDYDSMETALRKLGYLILGCDPNAEDGESVMVLSAVRAEKR